MITLKPQWDASTTPFQHGSQVVGFNGEVHWNEWGQSWLPHFPDRETANEAAFIARGKDQGSHSCRGKDS